MRFSPSAKHRLTRLDLGRFPSDTLFDRLARAVCHAGCLPRKELFEAWELARRVRRRFRGGRVVDVAGGHGLLGHILLLLDDASPSAHVVDLAVPPSARVIADRLVVAWPRLDSRVHFHPVPLDEFAIGSGDVVVSCHACGALSDRVLDHAVAARARVAVMPCCHDVGACDDGRLTGWLDASLAIDVARATRLGRCDYEVWTQTIPRAITPKNRVLLGAPRPVL